MYLIMWGLMLSTALYVCVTYLFQRAQSQLEEAQLRLPCKLHRRQGTTHAVLLSKRSHVQQPTAGQLPN